MREREIYSSPYLRRKGGPIVAVVILTLTVFAGLNVFGNLVTVQDHNRKINFGKVDFGSGPHHFGSPDGNGLIRFRAENSAFTVAATVVGALYWDSLTESGCSRLTIRYLDADLNDLHVHPIADCFPGGDANDNANKRFVSSFFEDPRLWYVRISVNETVDGRLLPGTSRTVEYPPDRSNTFSINSGTADFGNAPGTGGTHLFGAPTSYAIVDWGRTTQNPGQLNVRVLGTLYWDALSPGCAQVEIRYQNILANTNLDDTTRFWCGPGGNANDASNKRAVDEGFGQFAVNRVDVRVGSLAGSSFVNVTQQLFSYFAATGNFELLPEKPNVGVNETVNFAFTWNVPEPRNWHDLRYLQFRITDGPEIILWLLWDEASNSFSLYNEQARKFGRAFPAGSFARLQTPYASLDLSGASVTAVNSVFGSGPDSPSVLLNLPIRFKPSAAGRTLRVDVAASDDLRNDDPFVRAGTVAVSQ